MAKRRKTPKGKGILIQGRNVSQEDRQLYAAATLFFLKELGMTQKMLNTLTIKVKLTKTKTAPNNRGECWTKSNGSQATKNFEILIDSKREIKEMLSTLAHECVHIQQIAYGRLQHRVWASDKKLHVRWEGEEMGAYGSIPYRQQPWEIEAFSQQEKLAKSFLALGKK